jgi:hypothetical protein
VFLKQPLASLDRIGCYFVGCGLSSSQLSNVWLPISPRVPSCCLKPTPSRPPHTTTASVGSCAPRPATNSPLSPSSTHGQRTESARVGKLRRGGSLFVNLLGRLGSHPLPPRRQFFGVPRAAGKRVAADVPFHRLNLLIQLAQVQRFNIGPHLTSRMLRRKHLIQRQRPPLDLSPFDTLKPRLGRSPPMIRVRCVRIHRHLIRASPTICPSLSVENLKNSQPRSVGISRRSSDTSWTAPVGTCVTQCVCRNSKMPAVSS